LDKPKTQRECEKPPEAMSVSAQADAIIVKAATTQARGQTRHTTRDETQQQAA